MSQPSAAQELIWSNINNYPDDLIQTQDAWTASRSEDASSKSYRIAADDIELTEQTRITRIAYYSVDFGDADVLGHDWYIYEYGNNGSPGALLASGYDNPVNRRDTGYVSYFGAFIYENIMEPTDLVLEPGRYFLALRSVQTFENGGGKYSMLTTRWANGSARANWNFGVYADGTVFDDWVTMDVFNGVQDQEWAFEVYGEPATGGLRLTGPDPGTAGDFNTLAVDGATPGKTVYFGASPHTGTTNVPGCPGLVIDLGPRIEVFAATADANGHAEFVQYVPHWLYDWTIYFQAAERATCRVSNRVEHIFH
ncbi:MAG: hypothetical protein D8M59_11860 [Planctomycetes bacterium]|nr:hypothetical protein [Planctomycetota bacterium]